MLMYHSIKFTNNKKKYSTGLKWLTDNMVLVEKRIKETIPQNNCMENFLVSCGNFAIPKVFYEKRSNDFLLSDNLRNFSNYKGKKESLVLYSLFYHFISGHTYFFNINHIDCGERAVIKNKELTIEKYWNLEHILTSDKKTTIHELSSLFKNKIEINMSMIKNERISLSLTGGADTRNLLSVFYKLRVKPHLYTYGNPKSADCIKARKIAEDLGLVHTIHDIKMDSDLFEKYARKIIALSGGMASIHRAHRLIAVEREKEFADYMFLGTLGGEFVKGVSEDDYIIPAIVYENWNRTLTLDNLEYYIKRKRLILTQEDKLLLLEEINSLPYMNGSVIERKLNALSYITAHLHDAQDINLYETVMDKVFTPFLDIEYLKLLFSSKYSFDKKESIKNKRLKRIENPVFASEFLNEMYPPLLKFEYSGEHRPDEVLINKYYAAMMKGVRQKVKRRRYPPNFPLGQWMVDFVKKNLPLCMDYPILKETFDIEGLIKDLSQETHQINEAYWLKYTNPIQMRFIIEEFGGC